tara:strand:- start:4305 stop:4535 length:231 start_codon:yes stop_codon:yes gene_type:complete
MSEENTLEILKMLVERIKQLERQVMESEMNLMKSGFVAHTPRPIASVKSNVPNSDTISKMSWSDLDNLVEQMEGTL